MKDFVRKKRARAVLKGPSAKESFLLDDLQVREARHHQSRKKTSAKEDCGFVPVPEELAKKCQDNPFLFLSWNIWFRLVTKLKAELRGQTSRAARQTNGQVLFSLFYGRNDSFPKKFGRRGFILEIHQDWAADILRERFGIAPKMFFRHPCPWLMYENLICQYLMRNPPEE